ncbi:MAG: HAD hydrolase family protein [Chthoniobacterales bacterium]
MCAILQTYTDQKGTWVINTGRSFEHMSEGLEIYHPAVLPQFLIVNERHIFELCDNKYSPWCSWNNPCDEQHLELWKSSAPLIEELRSFSDQHKKIQFIDFAGNPEGVVVDDMETMEKFIIFLDEGRKAFPDFSYERNSVYLRFSHVAYSKGRALQYLQKSLGISSSSTAAAGDNLNDLSMLKKEVAEFMLCPGNAVDEVKSYVKKSGGQIGDYPAEKGIIQALEKLTDSLVCELH